VNRETTLTVKTGDGGLLTQTSTLRWTDQTLVITTRWPANEKTTTFVLQGAAEMAVTSATAMLYKETDGLTAGTIAMPTRIYRRSK